MGLSAGADIESICSKCGDVWHVIVAMVGDKVAKVQCKECNGLHRYRPPGGAKTKAAAVRTRKKSTGSSSRSKAKASPSGPAVEPDIRRPTRPYRASEEYQVADRVDHVKFGIGVVEETEPGKMTVWFPVGRKVLVQARPAPKLERPPRFVHED
jgi:hypothetical protein